MSALRWRLLVPVVLVTVILTVAVQSVFAGTPTPTKVGDKITEVKVDSSNDSQPLDRSGWTNIDGASISMRLPTQAILLARFWGVGRCTNDAGTCLVRIMFDHVEGDPSVSGIYHEGRPGKSFRCLVSETESQPCYVEQSLGPFAAGNVVDVHVQYLHNSPQNRDGELLAWNLTVERISA